MSIRIAQIAFVALCVIAAGTLQADDSTLPATGQTELRVEMTYFSDVVEKKLSRHTEIRNRLGRMFLDDDGRDRYLLNMIALVRRRGILNGKIRSSHWNIKEYDAVYGYAASNVEVCGFWYLWLPRCLDIETNWRRVEGQWYILPPEKIRLDPEVKKALRRL